MRKQQPGGGIDGCPGMSLGGDALVLRPAGGHGQAAGDGEEGQSLTPWGMERLEHCKQGHGLWGSRSGLACKERVRCGANALQTHDGDCLLPQGPTWAQLDWG